MKKTMLLLLPLLCCFASCFLRSKKNSNDAPVSFVPVRPVESPYFNMPGTLTISDSTDFRIYEQNGVRVYCPYAAAVSEKKGMLALDDYEGLFRHRLLNGYMFFCFAKTANPCWPYADTLMVWHGDTLVAKPMSAHGFSGPSIIVHSVRMLDAAALSHGSIRRLEIRTSSLMPNITGFMLEVENDTATKNTSWKEFLDGAKLTSFYYAYSEI